MYIFSLKKIKISILGFFNFFFLKKIVLVFAFIEFSIFLIKNYSRYRGH